MAKRKRHHGDKQHNGDSKDGVKSVIGDDRQAYQISQPKGAEQIGHIIDDTQQIENNDDLYDRSQKSTGPNDAENQQLLSEKKKSKRKWQKGIANGQSADISDSQLDTARPHTPAEADIISAKVVSCTESMLKSMRKLLAETPSTLDVDYTDPSYNPREYKTRIGQHGVDPRIDLAVCLKRMAQEGELEFVTADYRLFTDESRTTEIDGKGHWTHRIPSIQPLGTVDARLALQQRLSRCEKAWPPQLPPIRNPEIQSRVFTHRSSAGKGKAQSYERLEYLGDSFIHYAVTRVIYLFFPSASDGELSEMRNDLVSNSRLASYANIYEFDKKLITSDREVAKPTAQISKVYADLFEAYIGGILHDNPVEGGVIAEKFIADLLSPTLISIEMANIRTGKVDKKAKDKLYSYIGGQSQAIAYIDTPVAAGVSAQYAGYTVKCVVADENIGKGWATNRADAQFRAAMDALKSPSMAAKYRRIKVAHLTAQDREMKNFLQQK